MPELATAGRLSGDVRPTSYRIDLTVLPEKKSFFGKVLIDINLSVPSNRLSLHALELKIGHAELITSELKSPQPKSIAAEVTINPASETLDLRFPQDIPAGKASIAIDFSGDLNQDMRGLYEAHAVNEIYAFTQFEATDARRMFPCFDEPGMKARFQLNVTAPADLVILSNMPAINETSEEPLQTVCFDISPPMSTYLLALAVARLEKKEIEVDGVTIAVWTLPEQLALADFALKVTAAVLPRLNAYFALPYPITKLDLVSVPDFAMGAMENWGLIFFRDSCLLLDEQGASTEMQRRVASVITHEIVHQWFGNLVTMAWWDDLWLNESFATWLACKIIDQWRPEWQSWLAFQEEKEVPLALDAIKNTRPIRSDSTSPAEIEAMFDVLTYEKGGACLRMIEQFLGEDPFCAGIRSYIKDHQYKNATAEDLWEALSVISDHPISEIAKDWFTRPGFPILTFDSETSDFTTLRITQNRYSAFGNEGLQPSAKPWSIPVSIRYGDDDGSHTHRILLTAQETQVKLPAKGKIHWLYGNANAAGFYRTDYAPPLMKALEANLESVLSPIERLGVLADLWALCQSGDKTIASFLETLSHLSKDENRSVLVMICNILEMISKQILSQSEQSLFATFVEDCLGPMWEKLSWDAADDDDDERRLLRAALLWALGAVAQNEDILSELPRRQRLYLARPDRLDPTLATAFTRLCVRSDGGTRFEYYLERFRKSKTPEERDRYLIALSDFGKGIFAKKVLDFALSDEVRPQDVWKPVRALLANPAVQAASWSYLKTHWQAFRKKGGSIGAQRMIQATRHLWRTEWHDEVAQFFNKAENRVPSADRSLAQTLEFIQLGLQFKHNQTDRLSSWLRNRQR